jgi:hypothetical protein
MYVEHPDFEQHEAAKTIQRAWRLRSPSGSEHTIPKEKGKGKSEMYGMPEPITAAVLAPTVENTEDVVAVPATTTKTAGPGARAGGVVVVSPP